MNGFLKGFAVAALGLVLCGCSGSGSKPAVSTCKANISGVDGEVVVTAPGENQAVENVKIRLALDLKESGLNSDSKSEFMMDLTKTLFRNQLKETLGITDDESIKLEMKDDVLDVEVYLDTKEQIEKMFGTSDPIYSEVIERMKDQGATCS